MTKLTVSRDARRSTDRARPGGGKAPPGDGAEVVPARVGWWRWAACRKAPTELFFPVGKSQDARGEEERAKTVCVACPVRTSCLAFALEREEPFGVWGGLNESERLALALAARQEGW